MDANALCNINYFSECEGVKETEVIRITDLEKNLTVDDALEVEVELTVFEEWTTEVLDTNPTVWKEDNDVSPSDLVEDMNKLLAMDGTQSFSDVTFEVHLRKFYAHKGILAGIFDIVLLNTT